MNMLRLGAIALSLFPGAAFAQMSVSTFGATDAQLCYEAAADDRATNTEDCDEALKNAGLTARDRLATYVNRGIILNRNGSLEEALDDFNNALEKDSELAEALLNRGNTYFLMHRFDEAISDYEASLRNDLTKAHIAWYNIGLAQEAKRDDVAAKDAYRMSLEINPEFGPAQKKLGLTSAPNEEQS